jgi:uncharacterized protein YndB with AHSA1/START domain
MTVVAEFTAPVARLWDAYADPRQLEKFWGPDGWPATFSRHDFNAGGLSHYYMTGPDGEQFHGLWEYVAVEPHKSVTFYDKFAVEPGVENTEMPALHCVFAFEATDNGSRVTALTTFPSIEALEQLAEMGMEEGLRSGMAHMDDVLADLSSFAAGAGSDLQIIDDTHVRISRVIRGTPAQVWEAHHNPELMKKWLLGPDGWVMTEAVVGSAVGERYRNVWEPEGGGEGGFGFEGKVLEMMPGVRSVTTESMIGMDGPPTVNEQTFTPVEGGTLLTLVITYPSVELRDMIIATGMVDGMEASYARLEGQLAAV